jgi:hypothetical protein
LGPSGSYPDGPSLSESAGKSFSPTSTGPIFPKEQLFTEGDMLPNFFIIGAPQCGVSAISRWLSEHHDVFLPAESAPHFYATDLQDRITERAHYDALYEGAKSTAIGDASPWYLFSDVAIDNILRERPNARFVVCLRNPVEMAWLLHQHNIADQYEHIADFNIAWAMSHLRAQGRGSRYLLDPKLMDYASVCALGSQIDRLARKVDAGRIHIVFHEDLVARPEEMLCKLEVFLGISPALKTEFRLNEPIYTRPLPSLHIAIARALRLKRRLVGGRPFNTGLSRWLTSKNRRVTAISRMPKEMRARLSRRLAGEIGLLSALSDRDLSHWLGPVKP